ncbi:hypothetical protein BB8028_0003g02820 [Beauveria bassiana]|uniref:Uncharacterized protein n=1 Tax=Beauveria bassiana TaxID=176275 RepID=A0A2S7Y640_BEABA|nr:hypothetical protein BB8028_0003g02820 [Beauveria bassiana]
MPAPKGGRRQPAMPNLNLSRQQLQQTKSHADPTSPPHTPTASPQKTRKSQPVFDQSSRSAPMDPHIRPVGHDHQFSYRPTVRPEQLSPRSSSSEVPDDFDDDEYSSGDEDGEEEEEEEEEDDEEDGLDYSRGPIKAPSPLAASDTQSSSEEEPGSEEDIEEDDEEVEDSERDNSSGKRPIPSVGRVVHMEEVNEDDDDGDDDDDDDDDDEYDEEEEDEDDDDEEEEEEEEDVDNENEEEGGDDSDNDDDGMSRPTMESPVYTTFTTATTTICDFVLEEIDPMDSDNGLSVLDPYEIESNRSRSSSKHRDDHGPPFEHRELPIRMMQDMRNLHCSNEASDEEAEQDTEEAAFYKWQQYMRRRRLSVSSSITGKRTFSERSASDDSDDGGLDVNEVGSSARRMRKRLHRGSLLFQDPPEPRIDELEEPNSSEDEYLPTQHLCMQLPYWTIEINEMEDSQ